jgi:outer membrane protein OmpA-like peptidoglycan-associated protein
MIVRGNSRRSPFAFGPIVIFMGFCQPPCTSQTSAEVSVKHVSGVGVRSNICKVSNPLEKGTPCFLTGRDGRGQIRCDGNDQIRAEPIPTAYYWSETQSCAPQITLTVQVTKETLNFLGAARAYQDQGQAANAALLYNDLAVRFEGADPIRSLELVRLTYEQVGKVLNVGNSAVESNGRVELSAELGVAVMQFQESAHLVPNGVLNLQTLLHLAKIESGNDATSALILKGVAAAAPLDSLDADAINRELKRLRDVVANIDDYKMQTSASVTFAFNKAALTPSSKEDLDKLAGGLQSDKRFVISVEGYTDATGDRAYNESLSRKRADAVVTYLVTKHDIPIYRIHMIGLGKEKPMDDGQSRPARANNRRVEVKVFSPDLDSSPKGKDK